MNKSGAPVTTVGDKRGEYHRPDLAAHEAHCLVCGERLYTAELLHYRPSIYIENCYFVKGPPSWVAE